MEQTKIHPLQMVYTNEVRSHKSGNMLCSNLKGKFQNFGSLCSYKELRDSIAEGYQRVCITPIEMRKSRKESGSQKISIILIERKQLS